jgi:sugar-specific transcriptional regulator TrmB
MGFGVSSAPVYATIEKYGELSVSDIVRHGRLHRPAVYRGLAELRKWGLITLRTHGKRVRYRTTGREVLKEVFQRYVQTAKEGIGSEKSGAHYSTLETHGLQLFRGAAAIREIFADVLNTTKRGDIFYRITSERDLNEVNSFLPKNYRKMRDEKRLERLVISNIHSGSQKKKRLERFIRFIGTEAEAFLDNVIKLIYGDTVAYIDITKKMGYIIRNEHIANFEKTIFKNLYRKL